MDELKTWASTWGIKIRTSDPGYICTILGDESYSKKHNDEQWLKFSHTLQDLPSTPFVLIDITTPEWKGLDQYDKQYVIDFLKDFTPVLTNVPAKITSHAPHAITLKDAWRNYWLAKGTEDALGNIKVIVDIVDNKQKRQQCSWFNVAEANVIELWHQHLHALPGIEKHFKTNITFESVAELNSELATKNPLLNYLDTKNLDAATISHIQDIVSP